MKTVLKLLLMFSAMFAVLQLSGCSQKDSTNCTDFYTPEDSTFVRNIVEDVQNPSFNNAEDMKNYCLSLRQESSMLDVALAMNPVVIHYVFKAINPSGNNYVNLKTLVKEYVSNKELYDNLAKSESSELDKYPTQTTDSAHSDTVENSTTN